MTRIGWKFWQLSQNRDKRNRFVYNPEIGGRYEPSVRISSSTPKLGETVALGKTKTFEDIT